MLSRPLRRTVVKIARILLVVSLIAVLQPVQLSALTRRENRGSAQDEPKPPQDEQKKDQQQKPADPMSPPTFAGLKLRSIGPAFTEGRVCSIAVDPTDHTRYFIGAASGGVWKTTNAGITWTPVFDNEGSYSIGTITIDPKNPFTVW